MGKVTHKDAADMTTANKVSKDEWKASDIHLDSQGNTLELARSATLIVAASNASAKSKAGADYVCDGVADNVEIQAAIDALSTTKGKVQLSEGTFYIAASISIISGNITLEGMGISSTWLSAAAAGLNDDIIDITSTSKVEVLNLSISGTTQTAGNGIHVYNSNRVKLKDLYITACKENGIYLEGVLTSSASWGNYIDKVIITLCDETGISLLYTQTSFITFSMAENNDFGLKISRYGNNQVLHSFFETNNTGVMLSNTSYNIVNGVGANGCADYGIRLYASKKNIVKNCTIAGSTAYGIFLSAVENDNNIVTQNVIYDAGDIGLYSSNGTNNYFAGNQLVSATMAVEAASISYAQHSDLFMDVLAVSATAIRSNEDLSEAIPNTFTLDAQPDVPRTLSGHFDAHAQITAYTIVITGVDAKGDTITETKTETDLWDWETSNAFATITSIIMTARTGTGAGDTMDIGITDVLGLSNKIYATSDVYKIKKDNANATVVAGDVDTTYGTYDMHTIGLAATNDFTIWYKSNLNIIS